MRNYLELSSTAVTPLLFGAAQGGTAEDINALVSAGANVHAFDDLPLRWAASAGNTNAIKALRDNGANVEVAPVALKLAEKRGHTDTAEVLRNWIKAPERPVAPTISPPALIR